MKKLLVMVFAMVVLASLVLAGCAQAPAPAASSAAAPSPSEAAPASSAAAPASSEAVASSAAAFNPADYPIDIDMPVKNHPVHRIVQLGFLKAAKELGYTAQVIGTEGPENSEVWAAAETAAAQGVKGIMLWAGDNTAYPVMKKLKAAGVAVGIAHFKHDPAPEGLTFNMACDASAYGKAVADFIADKIQGKTGSIAITQNTKNITENAAADAFAKEIAAKNLSGVKVLPVELEGSDINAATGINAAIIQKNPDLIAAFGTTGNSPVTWADAAAKAGKKAGEIVIVGMDYTEANLAKLEAGEVAAIVAQPLYDEAYKTAQAFDQYFRTGKVDAWTQLDAPIVFKGGTGPSDPATYKAIVEEVKTWFK
jgi:ribose transport system substrate-binding protein